LATQQQRSQIFQERSVEEIIAAVLAPYGEHGSWRFSDETGAFLAEAPVRGTCTQYRETDYAFLCRLLAEEGLGFRFEEAEDDIGRHCLVIFAASAMQAESAASPARYHRSSAQEPQDTVQALVRHTRQAVAQIGLSLWHVDAKRLLTASAPNRHAAHTPSVLPIEYDDVLGLEDHSRNITSVALLERYAGLVMESVEAHADTLVGRSVLRALRAGERLQIAGAPALGLTDAPDGFITAVEHVGFNDFASGGVASASLGEVARYLDFDTPPASPVQPPDVLGLAASLQTSTDIRQPDAAVMQRARETGYANLFAASHTDRPWHPPLASARGARLHHNPLVQGAHSALVVGPDGSDRADGANELYCNAHGDIRIRFHWQDAASASGEHRSDNRLTRWVRVAQPQTGPGMGWQWLPRIGQEVLVRFVQGDPDQPIVVGALYNGQGEAGIAPSPGGHTAESEDQTASYAEASDAAPSAQDNRIASGAGGHAPAWHGMSSDDAGHRNAAALSGFKSHEFGGEGFNQLVFDDSDGQLRIQVHSATAHSQLNLGHIIHQQDNYRGSFRGEGFELRSDAHTALRGGQGVLISTYHGPQGMPLEPVGDAAGLLALVAHLDSLGAALHQSATGHQAAGLVSHAGAGRANTSAIDPSRAPIPALRQVIATNVDRDQFTTAQSDAAARSETDESRVPHLGAPIVALAARDGLVAVAGQHLQWNAGETVTLASAEHVNAVFAGQWRAHSQQALSVLAAAAQPDHDGHGLQILAAQDAVDVQAQHDTIRLLASDKLSLASVAKHIDLAAAKTVRIANKHGASIDITIECPGNITYHTAMRKMNGPVSNNYNLPQFPRTSCKSCLLDAMRQATPGVQI